MRIGEFFLEAFGNSDVGFGRVVCGLCGSTDDVGIERFEDGDFLGGHFLGEGDDRFVSYLISILTDESQSGTSSPLTAATSAKPIPLNNNQSP